MIVDKINEYLSQHDKTVDEALRYEVEKIAGVSFKRQFMTEENGVAKGTLRLSSAGRCPRQLAYTYHGFEKKGKEIDSRAKLIFWTGDLTEMTIVSLAKIAGCQITATGLNQLKIKFKTNGSEIEGHPDGLSAEDKLRLIEVKSMSSFGFDRFVRGEIDGSYIAQVNAYMEALNLDETIFIGYNKDSGIMHETIVKKDPDIVSRVRANLCLVLQSTPENLPEPPEEYAPNSKGFYAWQCLYCAYWGHCRTNAEKVLVGKSYKLKYIKPDKKQNAA